MNNGDVIRQWNQDKKQVAQIKINKNANNYKWNGWESFPNNYKN